MSRVRGYTLLEILVVVALLALATSLVAPAGYRMITSWREAGEVDEVLQSISALPLRARAAGRELVLPDPTTPDPATPDAAHVELPDGWRLEMHSPLTVRANGACSDAAGILHTTRQLIDFRVAAPFCAVRRVAADGQ